MQIQVVSSPHASKPWVTGVPVGKEEEEEDSSGILHVLMEQRVEMQHH